MTKEKPCIPAKDATILSAILFSMRASQKEARRAYRRLRPLMEHPFTIEVAKGLVGYKTTKRAGWTVKNLKHLGKAL